MSSRPGTRGTEAGQALEDGGGAPGSLVTAEVTGLG